MNSCLEGLVSDYQGLRHSHSELVLATIIDTQGSTYQKAGARMLITSEQQFYGVLGGAELHKAIMTGARSVFSTRSAQILDLDPRLTDVAALDMELEAGAGITVLLEYLSVDDKLNPMELLMQGLQQKDAVLVTVCDSGIDDCRPGSNVLIAPAITISENLGPVYCQDMADIAAQIRQSGAASLESCISGDGSFTAFYYPIIPKTQLLIVGAGPDAIPLLRLARAMGWSVTVVDPRASFTESESMAQADRVLTLEPEELSANVALDTMDAAVIMTHRLDLDARFLQCLHGNTTLKYLGLLGTKRRREKLLKPLVPDPDRSGENIYCPVGLDLGARTPDQIALSIVSEIQAVLNNRTGGQLSALPAAAAAVPAASEKDLYAVVLAAGGSRRFGGIKQLLELDGRSLLKRTINTACNTFDNRVKLVLGIKPNKLQREADGYDLEIVINRDWENGIASSLRTGINSLPSGCKAALIILCDQPLINESHLLQLISAWKQNPGGIIASSYADTYGVPAIFPQAYFPAILELKGDYGAKSVLDKHREAVKLVPIPEAGVDIDTQEDLIKILSLK